MTTHTDTKYIVHDPDVLGGKPCIEGHRIAVHHIAWWYSRGESAEDLARDYSLTPAEVHAALVYYYDHKNEIDGEIEREAAKHAALAEEDHSPVAERMRTLIAEREQLRSNGHNG